MLRAAQAVRPRLAAGGARRGLAPRRQLSVAGEQPQLRVTTLANGVRVATDPTPGHFVAAGVYVGAGSRFEAGKTTGAGHLVDKIAFKSTLNRSKDQMTADIEALGGQFHSASSRETIMYQTSTYTQSLPAVMSIFADTVLHPVIEEKELDIQKNAALWEVSELQNKPELILPEIFHEVAYADNTLGNPILCPPAQLEVLTPAVLGSYIKTWYRPERIVVAAAGVEHDEMVELADKFFGVAKAASYKAPAISSRTSVSPNPPLSKSLSTSAKNSARVLDDSEGRSVFEGALPDQEAFSTLAGATAKYTGGQLYLEKPDSEFTHIYIGFEALSIFDPDIYTLATLQILLGGGASFSAGGPGKGMYSRLYTQVLNQHHHVDFCSSFHHCYADSGLFGIMISVRPQYAGKGPQIVAAQLDALTNPTRGRISETDLSRAKNQLKSSLIMALESRLVQVEDLGRQVQAHGSKVPVAEMLDKISQVTIADLYRVAGRVIRPHDSALLSDRQRSGKPTILVQGPLESNRVPDVKEVMRRYDL